MSANPQFPSSSRHPKNVVGGRSGNGMSSDGDFGDKHIGRARGTIPHTTTTQFGNPNIVTTDQYYNHSNYVCT